MPFNLLIFPIVGGYYILIRSELVRYTQQRIERQKLIFNAILGGMFMLFVSWIITSITTHYFPCWVNSIRVHYPLKSDYFGTAVCSLVLSVGLTELLNLFVDKDRAISRAINNIGSEFERLVDSCYRGAELIQITLSNGKCYVGWVKALPIPSYSSSISILPVYSGYRNNETKELIYTTQYLDVYASYVQDGIVTSTWGLTNLVIKIDCIVTAGQFNNEMYERFLRKDAPTP